jgi:hypothetical protein
MKLLKKLGVTVKITSFKIHSFLVQSISFGNYINDAENKQGEANLSKHTFYIKIKLGF